MLATLNVLPFSSHLLENKNKRKSDVRYDVKQYRKINRVLCCLGGSTRVEINDYEKIYFDKNQQLA